MPRSIEEKRADFQQLHRAGIFLLPNPWDVGSARLFATLGFKALASTSTGYAWTAGRPDYALTRDDVLAHLAALSAATDLPVNADFESGFADTPEALAANVGLAIETGIAGLSIEDRIPGNLGKLYETPQAVARIEAARAAIDASGMAVTLVARTEGLLVGGTANQATDKLVALADAGADCLYAPGIGMAGLSSVEDAATLVRAVAPKPVNILVMGPGISLQQYADIGVRRISVGGALAEVAWGTVLAAAAALKEGDFSTLSGGLPGAELNKIFGAFA
jgi:2-methylisocitrate lyase-like PEP mutase family enzyme